MCAISWERFFVFHLLFVGNFTSPLLQLKDRFTYDREFCFKTRYRLKQDIDWAVPEACTLDENHLNHWETQKDSLPLVLYMIFFSQRFEVKRD